MRLRLVVIALVAWTAVPGASGASAAEAQTGYDVIIRGGTVYDGSGGPGRAADVGIRGDRIVAVGKLRAQAAKRVIDATGLAVAPGFINMLSWATESLIVDGRSQGDIRQGVTLELLGEGLTMGPLNDALRERAKARMQKLGVDVQWTTAAQYLEFLERRGVAPNVASFVGATNVRMHVLGAENRKASPVEIERMQALVRDAMRDGAFGVTSALAYAPAAYADTDELIALARVAAEHGGIYISHIRDEGEQLLESVDEAIAIARAAKVPVEIYHLKALGTQNWPTLDRVIARIDAARSEGLKITADMYPYTASATGLDVTMPTWVQEGGLDAWIARLKDPAIRARLIDEMSKPYSSGGSNRLIAAGSPDNILILGVRNPALKPIVGKTLGEIARTRKTSVADTVVDLVIEDGSRLQVAYFLTSEDGLRKVLAQPWVSFGSDAESVAAEGAVLEERTHPRAYGTFARVLGKYVRDEKVISLAEAVRRLAALPAATLGLDDRGRLEPGKYADVVVFDPATIADRATFDDPHRYAVGVRDVFVNGTQVLANGEHTGATPGRFIRSRGAQAASTPTVAAAFADIAGPDRPGCAVSAVHDRKVVAAEGFGLADLDSKRPITADTNFDAASLSKQFTAFAILQLEQRGVLSLDDSVRKFVPELGEYAQSVKVRDLLYHTSGLRELLSISRIQQPPLTGLLDDQAALRMLARQPAAERPAGAEYMYSNSGYFLLSLVAQRASGESMHDLLERTVFKPLGMNDTRIEGDVVTAASNAANSYMSGDSRYTPAGRSLVVRGATGMHTTARDMAKWSENFWTTRAGGSRLIGRMMEVGALADGKPIDYAGGLTRTRYRGLTVLRHGGSVDGFRHNHLVFPEQRFAVAVLCNRSDAGAAERAEAVADVYLGSLMSAKEIPTEVTELATRPGRIDLPAAREGLYRDVKSGEYLALERKDAGRWVLGYRGRELALQPVSSQVYKTEPLQFRPIYVAFTASSVFMAYAGDYDEFASVVPWKPADAGRWAGTYHNEETGAQLRLSIEEGALTSELGSAKVKLRPGRVGELINGRGALIVPTDGPADWITLHMVGLRGMRFVREEAAAGESANPEQERAVDALFSAMDRPDTPGAAVGIYREGRVVYKRGYGSALLGRNAPVTASTVFHAASVSKQFTAFAIALLAREGKLDLDRKISTYLRDLPAFGDVLTVRDLVLHVNGLQEVNTMFWLAQRYRADNLHQQQALNLIRRQRELNFEPGTRFSYNNSGYTLLAEIVQSVSGQTLRQFTATRMFQPLGMRQTFFRDDAREIVPEFAEAYERNEGGWRRAVVNTELVGASGLYTTVDDMLKWLGNFDQPQVGDRALIEQVSTPGKLRDGKPLNYAFGLYRQSYAGHDAVAHDGSDSAYRSTIVYLPKERFGVVVLANSQQDLGTIVRKIIEAYLGAGAAARSVTDGGAPAIKPRHQLVQSVLGHYLHPYLWAADLVEKDGAVWWQSASWWANSKITFREGDVFSRTLGTELRYFKIERNARKEVIGFRALDAVGGDTSDLYQRAPPFTPSLAQLHALEGSYRTAELDITYTFNVVDGALTARSLWSVTPIGFQPVAPDRYDSNDIPMGSIRFSRDASGKPTGFRIVGGGMRGTVFERLP